MTVIEYFFLSNTCSGSPSLKQEGPQTLPSLFAFLIIVTVVNVLKEQC